MNKHVAAFEGPFETEFLLPQIRKRIELSEFRFVEENLENLSWSKAELEEEIVRLGHWEYYFSFVYGLTSKIHSTFNDRAVDFHRYRSKLITDTLVDTLGNRKVAIAEILDLACHCGVFSLDVAFRGAKHVHGIEYRRRNLSQAEFLKEYYRIPNVSFEQGDVYQLDKSKTYDVVMCLGILYHVVRPVDLIEFCYKSAREFAVIETICHKIPLSAYLVVGDKNPEVAIEGTRPIEFLPTYRGASKR